MTATEREDDDVDEAGNRQCFAAAAVDSAVAIGMRQHFCGSTSPSGRFFMAGRLTLVQ